MGYPDFDIEKPCVLSPVYTYGFFVLSADRIVPGIGRFFCSDITYFIGDVSNGFFLIIVLLFCHVGLYMVLELWVSSLFFWVRSNIG